MNALEIKRSIEKIEQMVNKIQTFIPANAIVALKQEIQKVHNTIGLYSNWAVITLEDIEFRGFNSTGISEEQLQDILDDMGNSETMQDQLWLSLETALEEEGIPRKPSDRKHFNAVIDDNGKTLLFEVDPNSFKEENND
jgi:hypothetical protein